MAEFQVGFHRTDITPPLGTGLVGFYVPRESNGILDPILASVLALSDGEKKLLIISLDVLGIGYASTEKIKAVIAERVGVPTHHIFTHCTHTHSAHGLTAENPNQKAAFRQEVFDSNAKVIAEAAEAALLDLAPAEVLVNAADNPVPISFIRRYRMKDGTTRTNPGFLNPDIDYPLGEADHRVALTLFKRENKPEIALINFQTHPCVVGGYKFSADYPYFLRKTYEAVIPNSYCMFIDGAEGDTNHFDVTTPEGLPRDGYIFAEHMGRTLAGTALSLYAMARPINPLPLTVASRFLTVEHNKAEDPAELIEAERLSRLYDEGKYNEVSPIGGMELTTVIGEARRKLKLAKMPDTRELYLMGLRMGDFALVGFPGEPFTEIGRQVKNQSPAKMTYIACGANGYEGYFPTQEAYDDGGYEARSATFRPGVAEALIDGGLSLLTELFEK